MVQIDFRKLISFGKGGHVVSLPRSWVKKNRLKKGDTLTIDEGSDQLIFSVSHKEHTKQDRSIVIEEKEKSLDIIKTEIIAAYLNYYNTIEIISEKNLNNDIAIKEILRNLAGIEIMEQTSKRIVARDLINIHDISTSDIIRRMDNIIRGMMEDCVECIKGNNCYDSIFHRDEDVNRLFYLVKRIFNRAIDSPTIKRILNTKSSELVKDRLMVRRIEKIGDRLKRIARILIDSKIDKTTQQELEKLFSQIRFAYFEVMKAYHTNNKEIAFNIEYSNKERYEECVSFLEKNTGCALNLSSNLKAKNNKKIEYKNTCVNIAKIVENLIGMSASIRYITRIVAESQD